MYINLKECFPNAYAKQLARVTPKKPLKRAKDKQTSCKGFHDLGEKHCWHWQTANQGMHAPHALRSLSV